jgi:hypothetical protein
VFLNHLTKMHPFFVWVENTIVAIIKAKDSSIEKDVVHMSMEPTLKARSYRGMCIRTK